MEYTEGLKEEGYGANRFRGFMILFMDQLKKFIGIYSGRVLHPELDLELVWKVSDIQELIETI